MATSDTPNAIPRQLSQQIKEQARGQWRSLLGSLCGLDDSILDGKGHPCPKCGGTDRFFTFPDFLETGGMMCRQCFPGKNGDGIAAVMWLHDCDFPSALKMLAETLRISYPASTGQHSSSKKESSKEGTTRTNQKKSPFNVKAVYEYYDASGQSLFQVARGEPKSFRQRKPDGKGGWVYSVKGVKQVPYHLPELLAEPEKPVLVVEGEKDADRLTALGFIATCNAGGAGKWNVDHAKHLIGREVVILPDNDEVGTEHAIAVGLSLHTHAQIKIVNLPGLIEKGDVSDWLDAGGDAKQLQQLIDQTPEWFPAWSPIDSIEPDRMPLFPVEVLPAVLKQWVSETAAATQTPPDLAALVSLAACRVAMRGRVYVQARPGWREPTNIYTVVLLEPANRKSAVFAQGTKPLREIERSLQECAAPDFYRAQSERRQKEVRLKKLEKLAGEKGETEAAEEALELAEEIGTSVPASLPKLIVENATAEKLEMLLAQQQGVLAVMSAEGGVFDILAGLYANSSSGAASLEAWLKGHAGDDIATERVTRSPVYIESPSLTACFTVQPVVFTMMSDNTAFRGRGLLGRFLYSIPLSLVGSREIRPVPVQQETQDQYADLLRRLAALEIDEDGVVLQLSEPADALFYDHEQFIESQLDDDGDLTLMKDWGGKLAGATLRIAGILHMAETSAPTQAISANTMAAAIEIAFYLIPHASRVFSLLELNGNEEVPVQANARKVLRWLRKHKREQFSQRDLHQHLRKSFASVEVLEETLTLLCEHNYLRELAVYSAGTGRKPSPQYEVNPEVFGFQSLCNGTQNTQNEAKEEFSRGSVNSVYRNPGAEIENAMNDVEVF